VCMSDESCECSALVAGEVKATERGVQHVAALYVLFSVVNKPRLLSFVFPLGTKLSI
jgi:hypothetical protein